VRVGRWQFQRLRNSTNRDACRATDLRHWFNLDWHRPKKHVGLVLDLGKRTKPVITPDDPQRVVAVLCAHGVEVAER
jgi:hypothetical protein